MSILNTQTSTGPTIWDFHKNSTLSADKCLSAAKLQEQCLADFQIYHQLWDRSPGRGSKGPKMWFY